MITPLLAIDSPVSVGEFPFDPNSRFNEPEGLDELFPVGSACQRKSCVIGDELLLLNEDACRSNGLELKPCVAVAVFMTGNKAPAADSMLLNVPLVKAAVVPLSPPVKAPPESCKYRASVKFVSRLRVPLVVIGPPVSPVPLLMFVTVPPELGEALVRVIVPPRATVPPPDSPGPACTVTELLASMEFVTPAEGMLIVPLLVIGPPARPAPVLMLVTVPPSALGKVCPGAKLISPLLAMDSPVSEGEFPVDPNSRFNEAEGLEELFPVGSACQRKSSVIGDELSLLNEDACKSNGLEVKPCAAVAVSVPGNKAPAADRVLVKVAVVPLRAPVMAPPVSCK